MTNILIVLGGIIAVAVLPVVVLYLAIQLWLARRDARLLRQVAAHTPAPDPDQGGCLGALLTPALVLMVIGGAIFLANIL